MIDNEELQTNIYNALQDSGHFFSKKLGSAAKFLADFDIHDIDAMAAIIKPYPTSEQVCVADVAAAYCMNNESLYHMPGGGMVFPITSNGASIAIDCRENKEATGERDCTAKCGLVDMRYAILKEATNKYGTANMKQVLDNVNKRLADYNMTPIDDCIAKELTSLYSSSSPKDYDEYGVNWIVAFPCTMDNFLHRNDNMWPEYSVFVSCIVGSHIPFNLCKMIQGIVEVTGEKDFDYLTDSIKVFNDFFTAVDSQELSLGVLGAHFLNEDYGGIDTVELLMALTGGAYRADQCIDLIVTTAHTWHQFSNTYRDSYGKLCSKEKANKDLEDWKASKVKLHNVVEVGAAVKPKELSGLDKLCSEVISKQPMGDMSFPK